MKKKIKLPPFIVNSSNNSANYFPSRLKYFNKKNYITPQVGFCNFCPPNTCCRCDWMLENCYCKPSGF